jgi:translation initiation factor IF-2
MKSIRINELARELEVKAREILERLPELGVTEKKTHSSSVDEDVAIQLRRLFGREAPDGEPGAGEPDGAAVDAAPPYEEITAESEPADVPAPPAIAVQEIPPAAPLAPAPAAAETVIQRAPHPLRPPIGGRATTPQEPAPPTIQIPVTPPPAASAAPQAEASPVAAPSRPAPAPPRPIPSAPKPGQVLSGPRQPLPGMDTRPAVPQRPPSGPRAPLPPGPPPAAPAAAGPAAPGQPIARPPARPPLVGQPTARPVVPPRPDLVQKLTQQRPAAPGQPQPGVPRPGAPVRPQASPVPGQPIYRGPLRPGQPIAPRPGGPGRPPGPGIGRPAGPRPMHPTSRAPLVPAVPLPGDQQRRTKDKRAVVVEREDEGRLRPVGARRQQEPLPAINKEITVSEGITVKELSEKLDIKAALVIKKLVERGIFATINQTLDAKLAEDVARAFGAQVATMSYEEEAMFELEMAENTAELVPRAPVVTIMGHVDHGKTSLLDAIREANVAEKEAGGITQHIGAYAVEQNGRKIVFIDTPGHEAFTRMRARGAKVTDVVILVVAADDGVMPQTVEAIDHAKAAKVPIIVAINKIDRPDAQPERIKQQLADRGLLAEDWGGDTVMVPVSAKMKQNLDLLLEMILLVTEMQNLKANPSRPAMGTVLEAKLDRGRGPVATVLVRNGTLRVGDFFICGSVFGKVRAMINDRGQTIRDAEPATPCEVLGLESLPEAGDEFQVVTDTAKAKQIVMYREAKDREASMAKTSRLTLEQLHRQMREGEVKELPIILKADVGGSAEVLTDTLHKLSTDKVKVRVLHSGVGAITESDVLLASASNAIIIGFNVRPERNASAVAEQEKVDIRLHTIIYNLTDEIKRAMTGLLEPVFREVYRGKAEVRETFRVSKVGAVAGCIVADGAITRDSEVRLLRDNIVIHTGKVGSLRRFKDDVSDVRAGQECGITIENYSDVKPGDVIEAFVTERVATEVFA